MFDFLGLKKKTDKIKILVVDDEPNIVQTLQDRLEMNDYKVITAGNGKEGLEKALQERPDVILLDVIMPIMDGHEAARHIRSLENNWVPIIFLSGRHSPDDIAAGIAASAPG